MEFDYRDLLNELKYVTRMGSSGDIYKYRRTYRRIAVSIWSQYVHNPAGREQEFLNGKDIFFFFLGGGVSDDAKYFTT